MKTLFGTLITVLTVFFVAAQNQANFKSIGKKQTIHTLSNNRFDESFVNDTIQQIGSVLINTKTGSVIKFLPDNVVGSADVDLIVGSRFLSVDPLSSKYPMLNPYQFANNRPIDGIDLDGLEYYYAADGSLIGKIGKNTQVKLVREENIKAVSGYITWANHTKFEANRVSSLKNANTLSTDVGMTNEELNTRALLTTIRNSESDGQAPTTYDAEFGMGKFKGVDLDKDGSISEKEKYADHPRKMVTAWNLTMDVAGAYQFKSTSWDQVKRKLNLPDFSPASQDKGALQLIRYQEEYNPRAKGVINNIKNGNISLALSQLNGTWTSLPAGSEQLITNEEALKLFRQNVANELSNKSALGAGKGQATL